MVSVGKLKRDPNSVELANKIIEQYQPKSVEDMQEALKDIFGPRFESMLKGEMNHHLGYESNDKGDK
ncbi:IS256 family transposase, partial [Bacillus subtilis]|nr:IS256 family transposase [Bacillus subtilis]